MNAYPDHSGMSNARNGKSTGVIIGIAIAGAILLTCLGGIGVLAIMLPSISKARTAAHELVASAQIRQIVIGLQAYASENADYLPPVGGWDGIVDHQMGGAGATLFDSPRIEGTAIEMCYAPPRHADGSPARLNDIANPSQWILVYEDPAILDAKFPTVAVGFADGQAQMVTREHLAAALTAQEVPILRTPNGQ